MSLVSTRPQCVAAIAAFGGFAVFALSGCGGADNPVATATPVASPTNGSTPTPNPSPVPTVNPFANTFEGLVALRTADNQLSGDFAEVSITVGTNSQVTGTLSTAPGFESEDEDRTKRIIPLPYQRSAKSPHVSRAAPVSGLTLSGSADPLTGAFTVTGNGVDATGAPVTVAITGTPQQISDDQITLAVVTVNATAAKTTGKGTLKGKNKVPLANGTNAFPLLTGELKIPQGVAVRFAPTGSSIPANPDEAETGDVVNFTLFNYHSPGFDGYSNIDSGGWVFSYSGGYFTVKVPKDAPISTGYTVRDRSTGTGYSANFEVIKCPLQAYDTTNTNFIGSSIMADVDFFPSLDAISTAAGEAGVKVYVTSSFRVAGKTVQGAIVTPADRSNHFVGHAIDMNVQYTDAQNKTQLCSSACLGGATPPTAVKTFIDKVKAAGLRYGGDFTNKDVVHFDDGYNQDDAKWLEKYGIIQQCAGN